MIKFKRILCQLIDSISGSMMLYLTCKKRILCLATDACQVAASIHAVVRSLKICTPYVEVLVDGRLKCGPAITIACCEVLKVHNRLLVVCFFEKKNGQLVTYTRQ